MATANTTWILSFKDRIRNPIQRAKAEVRGLLDTVKKIKAYEFQAVSQSIQELKSQVTQLNEPFINFDDNIKELQGITGVSDEIADKIGSIARNSAKAYGTDASQNIESYKILLSKLSPEIANNADALGMMGNHVNVLSKQMRGDTTSAVGVLTTAMNQYGISLDDPIKASEKMAEMMHVMSAAAQEGSAELPEIKSALEQSGMVAKTAKISFEELNAAIQVLDKGGKQGAEGGVAIRNIVSRLDRGRFTFKAVKDALGAAGIDMSKLSDHSLTLKERLEVLKPIVNDSALLSKMFGEENKAAAIALIQGTDLMGQYTTAITGTNSATEFAEVKMSSWRETLNRVTASIRDVMISVGQYTTPFQPAIEVTSDFAVTLSSMFSVYSGLSPVFAKVGKSVKAMAASIRTASVAFLATPIGMVVAGLTAVAAAAYLVTSNIKKQRDAILRSSKAWREEQAAIRVTNELQEAVTRSTAGTIAKLETLTDVASDETLALDVRKKALDELIEIDPRYREALEGELINIEKLKKSTSEYTDELLKNAKAKALRGMLEKNAEEELLAEEEKRKLEAKFEDEYGENASTLSKAGNAFLDTMANLVGQGDFAEIDMLNQKLNDLKDDREYLTTKITKGIVDSVKQSKKEASDTPKTDNPTNTEEDKPEGGSVTPTGLLTANSLPGKSGNKTITQNLDVKNYFNVSSDFDMKDIADKIVGMINDRLRDGALALE